MKKKKKDNTANMWAYMIWVRSSLSDENDVNNRSRNIQHHQYTQYTLEHLTLLMQENKTEIGQCIHFFFVFKKHQQLENTKTCQENK